jgi:hypothetical protein
MGVERLGYKLDPHVHGTENSLIRDFVGSNHIEGLWGQLKTNIKRTYIALTGAKTWEDFIFEALWRITWEQKPDRDKRMFFIETYEYVFNLDADTN